MGKNKQQVPRLRFPGFNDAWEQRKFKELVFLRSETVESQDYSVDIELENLESNTGRIIGNTSVRTMSNTLFKKGDILFGKLRPYLNKWRFADEEGVKSGEIWAFSCREGYSNRFIYCVIQSNGFLDEVNITSGTKMPRADWKTVSNIKITIPTIEEQTAIGNFFRQLDEAIASHQRKLERVKELKKSLLQKMFPKDGEAFPELRFPNFTDAWEQRKLGEVAERVTRKNTEMISKLPLTISAQYGLIAQTEFFDKQIASKNISGYYLIKNGEFAYNKSYSNGYPWGAVKRLNNYDYGVLSTLYIVFKPTNINSQFLVSYYDTNYWHNQVASIAVEGARNHGLLNISASEFFTTTLAIPKSIQEQTAIGDFFRQLDAAIASHQRKLEHMQTLKKGLLQQMFV